MGAMASQIASPTVVYSTVYSGADEIKLQSSASLAFVRGIHRGPVNSPHKGPVTRKIFPFDDVIMRPWHCGILDVILYLGNCVEETWMSIWVLYHTTVSKWCACSKFFSGGHLRLNTLMNIMTTIPNIFTWKICCQSEVTRPLPWRKWKSIGRNLAEQQNSHSEINIWGKHLLLLSMSRTEINFNT